VVYDRPNEMIVRGMLGHRRSITWVRPSLSGYQAGACFYCAAPIIPLLGLGHSADVRHYFPHTLMGRANTHRDIFLGKGISRLRNRMRPP
jgi:hypothetical protein